MMHAAGARFGGIAVASDSTDADERRVRECAKKRFAGGIEANLTGKVLVLPAGQKLQALLAARRQEWRQQPPGGRAQITNLHAS
jgi:hypothetical protein